MKKNGATKARIAKLGAGLMLGASILPVIIGPVAAYADYAGYSDLDRSHWAVSSGVVDWADSHNVISGYPDGTWRPDAQVNRAQAAAMIYNLEGCPTSDFGEFEYRDAALLDWATMAVYWANACGIVHGYEAPNGLRYYRPWIGVTREQVAAMLMAYVEGEPGSVSDLKGFSDWSSTSSWSYGAVAWAANNGIIGKGGLLKPQAVCTRSEFVAMLKDAYGLLQKDDQEVPGGRPSDWYPDEPQGFDPNNSVTWPDEYYPGFKEPTSGLTYETIYVASDGTRFFVEEDCAWYLYTNGLPYYTVSGDWYDKSTLEENPFSTDDTTTWPDDLKWGDVEPTTGLTWTKKYKASDGTLFDDKDECARYCEREGLLLAYTGRWI